MKSFKAFRLDTANHILWRNGDRVPMAPKSFDVLAYPIEHARVSVHTFAMLVR
jgi:DNA-binding response OmpR family regulator